MTTLRFRRSLAGVLAFGSGAALFTAVTLGVLWQQGTLKRWLQARAVSYYLEKIQPHLPFEIEEIEADAPFGELLRGRLKSLSAQLRWQGTRMRLSGPIELTRPSPKDPSYALKFDAIASLEPVDLPEERSTLFSLDLYAKAADSFDRLLELELYARAKNWEWKHRGLRVEEPDLAAAWKADRAELGVSLKALNWEKDRSHRLALTAVSASAEAPLKLKPFELGPALHFNAKIQRAQGRWENAALDLPLAEMPVEGHLLLTPSARPEVTAQAGPIHVETRAGELSWSTARLPMHELLASVLKAIDGSSGSFAAPPWLRAADVRAGTIQSDGKLRLGTARKPGELPPAWGVIRVEGGALRLQRAAFAARGIKIDLPFSTTHGIQGVVSASDLFYKRAHATLGPTDLAIENLGHDLRSPEGLKVRLGPSPRGGGLLPLVALVPLVIDEVPAQLGTFTGTILTEAKPWALDTSLRMPPVSLEKIVHPLCIKNHSHWPPVQIEADLSKIQLAPGTIDPDGQVTAHLFDGTIRAEDIGLFDLGTSAPELDFSLDFGGIQLSQLCDWSGFGEMIGTLHGYAHDVTFQGWLPTHFDLSFDAAPRPPSTWIEMDPEAVRNLVTLFAGNAALDHIPVVAHGGLFNKTFDPFFGWISRRMGGFDLKYLGLSLYSTNGTILLETHDLPEIYRVMKKHYVFWGHRLMMPLQSEHYPVVMDEHGVAHTFQIMAERAKAIAQAKRDKNGKADPENDEDENDPSCLPPLL